MGAVMKLNDQPSSISSFNDETSDDEIVIDHRVEPQVNESGNIVNYLGLSLASLFVEEADITGKEVLNFKALVRARVNYVRNLDKLGENWISGKSYPPNNETLLLGVEILKYLKEWYLANPSLLKRSIPSIVMGPIPAGGLSIEIVPQSEMKLYINIYNDGEIEMDVEDEGNFREIEIKMGNYKIEISKFLSDSTTWLYDPGWGDTFSLC